MPPQDLAPVGAVGFDAVFLDQVPDDLLERQPPCREVKP